MNETQPTQAPFNVIEQAWIPMPDGCSLAATIWLPASANDEPVPAVLEYLPYRRRDGTAVRDLTTHPYFASHGYASLRVDIRGTGDSGGTYSDEYSAQEHADAVSVINWIAAQPWCTGSVGMFGISWGGFNSLQVAAMRPEPLKAIITACSTDDRYGDDCHYQGGAVIANDMLPWAASLLAIVCAPADPSALADPAGADEAWIRRIDSVVPPVHHWLSHQTLDDYWRHGSVCEDYTAIEAATLVVGGWEDGYRNAALRLLERLTCPRRGLIGPWAHTYPHLANQETRIDFLGECLRWWDQWLHGAPPGPSDPPLLRTWISGWNDPASSEGARTGEWVGIDTWTDPEIATMYPGNTKLGYKPLDAEAVRVTVPQGSGLYDGAWCPYGHPSDRPQDQRAQDRQWVSFDSDPLHSDLPVFGFPEFACTVAADKPEAYLCLRLCDVAPDGTSLLVSQGILNLTHRHGHDRPRHLAPGQDIGVSVRLAATSHRFTAGHRIRLAISPTYFPRVWPAREAATLTLSLGQRTALTLPKLGRTRDIEPFRRDTEEKFPVHVERIRPGRHERSIAHNDETGRVEVIADSGLYTLNDDTLLGSSGKDELRIRDDDPLSAVVRCTRSYTVGSPDHPKRVEVDTSLTADLTEFTAHTRIEAYNDNKLIHTRTLTETFKRPTL